MPEPPQPDADRVAVSGGRGVVVGNYGTVFQIFGQAAPPLASLIRSQQFAALVDERTRGFIGRRFIFAEVDRQLSGADFDSGYVVISGEPGIGKTAIAASLVLRGGYVHHFNIASANIRSASQFLENVCAQLIVRYGLSHEQLPAHATEDGGFLSQVLTEAAEAARVAGDLPVVIVVDALDEADRMDEYRSANRLFLPRTLPEDVFVVLTAREEHDLALDVDHQAHLSLRDDDERNLSDAIAYVHTYASAHRDILSPKLVEWGVDDDEFVTLVVQRSEGNFMYLVHVLPELARGSLAIRDANGEVALPRGLQGYYQRHWRDMKAADEVLFSTRQRPVLCFLAISREPVGVPQLVEWTSLGPGEIKPVIDGWREFLNADSSTPPRYRLYHRSFADFLDKEENLRWYHDQIAQIAVRKIPGFGPVT
ncbi:MAG TPA: ATP-binding protein [Actinomycetales bacterium]|nr:ATP-binding protein [Actinomycetales bacterium]